MIKDEKEMEYILELKDITKTFPGVKALDKVQFKLKKGEIHALMGENGAGKSTFIKVITGVHRPDEGNIYLNGEEVKFLNPADASKRGIAAIYQHVTCYPHLSVAENIFIGHEITTGFRSIDWKQMKKRSKELLDMIGTNISPTEEMGLLSVAQQQMVEIAKALSMNAEIIIMDEPTASLTVNETKELYKICNKLRDSGKSIIFISHRMEDIYTLADTTTVFRDGQYIGAWETENLPQNELIKAMVGREISQLFPKKDVPIGDVILEVEGLSKAGVFKDISFNLRQGEILGITGLVGAGRTEVAEAIFGVTPLDKGRIIFEGKELKINHPSVAMQHGIGYLPEDRQKTGLVLEMEIGDNIVLPVLKKYSKFSWFKKKEAYQAADKLHKKLRIKANDIFEKVEALSGGNQQKVVVAKLLESNLKVIILDEPTKGIDVGSKSAIHELMSDLAGEGFGIIMISSEMEEVLGMSDRIVVMRHGRVTGEFDRKGITQYDIINASLGD